MNKLKQHRGAVGVALFCLLAVILAAVWMLARPGTSPGEKHIIVEVVHGDRSTAEFSYDTNEEYLGPLLEAEGLISGSESAYGLYVETVDGETADYAADGGWWKLRCNGEDSQLGVDAVAIADGDQYAWVYTTG